MSKKTLTKAIIGMVVIGGALTYFVVVALQSSYAYYIPVDEFPAKVDGGQGVTFRVAGKVGKDSIERDLKEMKLDFELAGKKATLPVTYVGVVPENFVEDREVVVEGKLGADGVFRAKKLMTKCDSKYEAKLNEGASD